MVLQRSILDRARAPAATKLALLALYLACDHAALAARIVSLGLSAELAAFAVLYGALAAALAAAAFTRSHAVRLALAAILAAGSAALHSYEWATGAPLVYEAFETMVASRGDAAEAFSQHGGVVQRALGAALILFAAVALPPGTQALPRRIGWVVPTGAVAALAILLYVRGGEGARALPAPFSPLAQGAIMATLAVAEERRPRQAVTLEPGPPEVKGDIVLVVDESVAANYLDINHALGVRSGLVTPRPGLSIANFGIAASVANCSAGSNLTLRYGGTRATYRRASRERPSLWAYALRAGLRTVYLDAQRRGGALQNRMTARERAEIGDFVQLGATSVPRRDHELAGLISGRLGNGVQELIVVNKVGAHFPVADKFPEEAALYRPLPPRGRSEGIIDIATLPGGNADSPDTWRLYRNAYRNTVAWSTGGFFDRLLPHVDGTGAVILYTSDHGQNLHERGDPGDTTHCVPDPLPEEGAVPLVVVADEDMAAMNAGAAASSGWDQAAKANRDRMSHFRLFPTLLQLMGYPPAHTEAFYGPTLRAPAREPLSFTSTYTATLGRDPVWRPIVPGRLAAPPASDYHHSAAGG